MTYNYPTTKAYITASEFIQRYAMGTGFTDAQAYSLSLMIDAVSRLIEGKCHRLFYASDDAVQRFFTAQSVDTCFIDDLLKLDSNGLTSDNDHDGTYSTAWASTDIFLMPANTFPTMWLERTPYGNNIFPMTVNGVAVVGQWGYSNATPEPVSEACYLQCHRLWERQHIPFGVVGSAEMGQIVIPTKLDPDVILMLQPVTRMLA